MVCVLTLDQRASRSGGDLVPDALATLNLRRLKAGLLRKFERTAGDEIQGVLSTPEAVVEVVADLLRSDDWYVGVGIGPVDEPLPRSTRAGRGPAFSFAREAVSRAKSSLHHVSVVGADPFRCEQVETVLWLLAGLIRRRTTRGWEVADLTAEHLTQREIAQKLGISQSAVSQRLQAAGAVEELRARALAVDLFGGADDEEAM